MDTRVLPVNFDELYNKLNEKVSVYVKAPEKQRVAAVKTIDILKMPHIYLGGGILIIAITVVIIKPRILTSPDAENPEIRYLSMTKLIVFTLILCVLMFSLVYYLRTR